MCTYSQARNPREGRAHGLHIDMSMAWSCIALCDMSTLVVSRSRSTAINHTLSLGKLAKVDTGPMLFDNQSIAWYHSIKYLGVHLPIGKGLSFYIAPIKRAFHAACNNIFSSFSWY